MIVEVKCCILDQKPIDTSIMYQEFLKRHGKRAAKKLEYWHPVDVKNPTGGVAVDTA